MTDASRAILALGVSILAVFLLTLVAGTSDSAANAALAFIVGLWLVFLVAHPGLGSITSKAVGG